MLYHLHDYHRALFNPALQFAQVTARMLSAPGSWLSQLPGAARVAAGYELFYRVGKHYEKPKFGIETVNVRGARVAVIEETVLSKPFCRLRRFTRMSDDPAVAARLKEDAPVLPIAAVERPHTLAA